MALSATCRLILKKSSGRIGAESIKHRKIDERLACPQRLTSTIVHAGAFCVSDGFIFFLFVHLLLAMLASDMTSLHKVLNEREQVSRIWTVNGIGSEGKALLRKYNPAHTPTDRSIGYGKSSG